MRGSKSIIVGLIIGYIILVRPIAAAQTPITQRFIGKKIGEILDFYRVQIHEIHVHDDPPGMLDTIFIFIEGRTALYIIFEPTMRSKTLKWDIMILRQCRICDIRVMIMEDGQIEIGGQITTKPTEELGTEISPFTFSNLGVIFGCAIAAVLVLLIIIGLIKGRRWLSLTKTAFVHVNVVSQRQNEPETENQPKSTGIQAHKEGRHPCR